MARTKTDSLEPYRRMRDFSQTPEPDGSTSTRRGKKTGLSFVVQKHAASRLHYDFRLEFGGVLKSWAVTKGPSLNPADKRLAVRTEDHPLAYGKFEGVIPRGYGAGTVMVWDEGEWIPQSDPAGGLKRGSLKFELKGQRLRGGWALVLMKSAKSVKGKENWLLIKERDGAADAEFDALASWTDSIVTGRDFEGIEAAAGRAKPGKHPVRAKVKFPEFVDPQLATLRDAPPSGDGWVHELKFDGYRIQALVSDGRVKLMTRNGKDWTARYPRVAAAFAGLKVQSAAIDGELVALDADGRSNFSALQTASESGQDSGLAYYAFDLLSLNAKSLRRLPLSERKSALRKLIPLSDDVMRYSDHMTAPGREIIAKACTLGLEGVISKKLIATYRSGRSTAWIKSKCVGREEFVIGGYRRSDKKGRAFSSLLVGVFENGELQYRGRVGSGFSEATWQQVSDLMRPLERKTSGFASLPADTRRDAVWLTPRLVAEVAYAERTDGDVLRHATFVGLREDKAAKQVTKTPEVKSGAGAGVVSQKEDGRVLGVRVSSPDRVVFENGVTKSDIANYMAEFSPHMLPYLKHHPVSLVRCPSGLTGDCFFQRHVTDASPAEFGKVSIKQSDGTLADYTLLDTAKALVAAAQIGVIELHLWGSASDRLEYPDRLVIDLDPDESLTFSDVRAAAFEVRDVLSAAGLDSFALLTGGKGIHVVAPLERRRDWSDVKSAAHGLARKMAAAKPEHYVSEMSKKKRAGKIFIDWLRNERGATAICPYSLRARPGAPIATPVRWDELARVKAANAYTILNIRQRMARLKSDPWAGYSDVRQSISKPVLEFLCE
ncbi:MAG: DNA ligase D [Hyphomonas sp.]